MDDEHKDNSGLGEYAWFKMGEWAAKDAQNTRDFCAYLGGYAPVRREDYDHAVARYNHAVKLNQGLGAQNDQLHAESRALRTENAQLRQAIQGWETDYAAMKVGVAERNRLIVDCKKALDYYSSELDEARMDLQEANFALESANMDLGKARRRLEPE